MLLIKKYFYILTSVIILTLVYFLNLIFRGDWILPQSLNLGFFNLRIYGLIMVGAVGVGYVYALRQAKQYKLDGWLAENLIFWVVLGGFLGARVYHIFSSASYYWEYPVEMLKVWHGGLSIYGAGLGGFFVIWILSKRYKLFILSLLNWLTPSLMLGQIIGRFGNLFNYEVYGNPTDLPWKMFVPIDFRLASHLSSSYYHPWFLYEQVAVMGMFWFLHWQTKSKRLNLFLSYVLLYNSVRFGLEFLRLDSNFIWGIRQNSLVSLCLVSVAGLLILAKRNRLSDTL